MDRPTRIFILVGSLQVWCVIFAYIGNYTVAIKMRLIGVEVILDARSITIPYYHRAYRCDCSIVNVRWFVTC